MFHDVLPAQAGRGLAGQPRPPRPWRVRDMLYGVALLLAALALTTGALAAAAGDAGPGATAAGWAALAFELLIGASVLLLAYRRGLSARDLGLVRPHRWGPAITAWVGAYLVLVAYLLLLVVLEGLGVDASLLDEGNPLPENAGASTGSLILFGLAVVAAAPLCEELWFRGLLFRGMRGYWRVAPAALVSGLAFGLFHLNAGVVLPFTLIGVLFAWANEQSGSLWTSIVAHAGFNGVSFVLLVAVMEP